MVKFYITSQGPAARGWGLGNILCCGHVYSSLLAEHHSRCVLLLLASPLFPCLLCLGAAQAYHGESKLEWALLVLGSKGPATPEGHGAAHERWAPWGRLCTPPVTQPLLQDSVTHPQRL